MIPLLTCKLGLIDTTTQQQIQNLPSNQLEELGGTLLNFVVVDELIQWLDDCARRTQNNLT